MAKHNQNNSSTPPPDEEVLQPDSEGVTPPDVPESTQPSIAAAEASQIELLEVVCVKHFQYHDHEDISVVKDFTPAKSWINEHGNPQRIEATRGLFTAAELSFFDGYVVRATAYDENPASFDPKEDEA